MLSLYTAACNLLMENIKILYHEKNGIFIICHIFSDTYVYAC